MYAANHIASHPLSSSKKKNICCACVVRTCESVCCVCARPAWPILFVYPGDCRRCPCVAVYTTILDWCDWRQVIISRCVAGCWVPWRASPPIITVPLLCARPCGGVLAMTGECHPTPVRPLSQQLAGLPGVAGWSSSWGHRWHPQTTPGCVVGITVCAWAAACCCVHCCYGVDPNAVSRWCVMPGWGYLCWGCVILLAGG